MEAFGGWGSLGGEQAWQIRLHGLVELWRIDTNNTIAFTAHHELIANPEGSINFNPRAARWEERLFWQGRLDGDLLLSAGGFHRCKHDIDNNEPPDDDTSNTEYVPTRRAIILSGIQGSIAYPLYNKRIWLQVGADWNIVAQDYRTPGGFDDGRWSNMKGAIHARVDADYPIGEHTSIGGSGWFMIPLMNDEYEGDFRYDARAELRFTLQYKVRLDLVASVDRQFDEVVFLTPQSTTAFQFGLRLGGF